jgi:predicted ATPase/DNA-binding CsgD family transcriptional regulator
MRPPVQLTTFVGREPELAALDAALRDARLVTVAGPGGCGKTRLAVAMAERRADEACWVDLAATADPQGVAEALAEATGAHLAADQTGIRALARQLADRRMLVCLDNCEHVLAAAAEAALELVRSCPQITVLATSREPLGIAGETVWRVPPMSPQDAVALFTERAAASDEGDEGDEVRIACVKLDGIPLAIELAAAWSGTLSVPEILQGLDDRFALLVRGPRGVAARHQTLAASMAWSHDLLAEEDRVLFRRLGVFHGGFTLEPARAVCGLPPVAAMAGLRRLVEKSLVVADTRGGTARYRMLETIRQYAVARLAAAGETAMARDLHLDAFLAYTSQAAPLLTTDKDAWRAAIGAEQENLRAALEWGLARPDPERGRRLAAALPWWWHLSGRGHEGLAFLHQAIELGGPDQLQARLLTGLALVADTTRPLGLEYDAAQAALKIADEAGDAATGCLARLLSAVGVFYHDFDEGGALAAAAQEQARQVGDGFVVDGATALMGIIAHLCDDHDEAVPLLRTAVAGLLGRGDRGVAATALGFLASSALYTGDLAQARELAEEAVRTARPLNDYHRVGSACGVLATVAATAGRFDEARDILDPMVRLVESADPAPFVPGLSRTLGYLHLWAGRPDEAIGWFEKDAGDGTYMDPPTLTGLAAARRAAGDHARAAESVRTALETARRIGLPRVTADALEQSALLETDPARAQDLHHEALALRAEHGLWLYCVDSLEALADLADRSESYAEAARLRAACARARADMGLPPRPGQEPDEDAISLPEAVAYARRARGKRNRPASGWASLTPAERSVVELAVEGLSNPDIGARLFMSRSTVKTHLSHIYAKLGVTNRTELATKAGHRS